MADFTIFQNAITGASVAVYDFNIPTVTGIGRKAEWVPVFHGKAKGLADKEMQRRQFTASVTQRKG